MTIAQDTEHCRRVAGFRAMLQKSAEDRAQNPARNWVDPYRRGVLTADAGILGSRLYGGARALRHAPQLGPFLKAFRGFSKKPVLGSLLAGGAVSATDPSTYHGLGAGIDTVSNVVEGINKFRKVRDMERAWKQKQDLARRGDWRKFDPVVYSKLLTTGLPAETKP